MSPSRSRMEERQHRPVFKCRSIDGANASTLFKPCASSIWANLNGIHGAFWRMRVLKCRRRDGSPTKCPSQLGLGSLSMVNRSLVNGRHRFAKPVTAGCTLVI
jgi:hypothetical protein